MKEDIGNSVWGEVKMEFDWAELRKGAAAHSDATLLAAFGAASLIVRIFSPNPPYPRHYHNAIARYVTRKMYYRSAHRFSDLRELIAEKALLKRMRISGVFRGLFRARMPLPQGPLSRLSVRELFFFGAKREERDERVVFHISWRALCAHPAPFNWITKMPGLCRSRSNRIFSTEHKKKWTRGYGQMHFQT